MYIYKVCPLHGHKLVRFTTSTGELVSLPVCVNVCVHLCRQQGSAYY